MERTFSTTELAKVLGKDTRFCISWTELGIFLADIQPAAGYASRRKFSYLGLLRAYLAIYFHETYGFQRKKIKDLMEILWRDNFFYQWKIGFPNAVKMLNKMAATIPPEQKSEGGCLFITDPYGKSPRISPSSMSVADTLRTLSEESIIEEFAGIQDLIALNLYDLKNDVDKRIELLSEKQ